MLYIISGASRSGKTILAKRLSKQKGISYLSLDWLMMGFTNGIPEYGIHDKLFPDEIAERMWSFLKAMIESMIHVQTDCVIEGEAVLPELITELMQKYPNDLSICFLGFIDVDVLKKTKEIKAHSLRENDWLTNESDEYIMDHVKNMIVHSLRIKRSCDKYNFRYVDTSANFPKSLQIAEKYLIEKFPQ